MARRTQGTYIWWATKSKAEPAKWVLNQVECPLNFKPGTDSKDKMENTCLAQEEYKTYEPGGGLSDTGQATFDLNADPSKQSHGDLYDMVDKDENVIWIVGWAGKNKGAVKNIVPEVDETTGEITLPPGRSWNRFEGYVESFPMDIDANTLVKTTVTIQRSTKVAWIRETVGP